MDNDVLDQLRRLAEAFNRIGLTPVICGGLGIYLLFRDQTQDVRATHDISLMITDSQAKERAMRERIAETITGELEYVVWEDGKHFRFTRGSAQQLDILAPPMEAVAMEGGRVKLVRAKLHGRLTPEACFIEEDLRTIVLTPPASDVPRTGGPVVHVPSPTNMLILKLFAFDDRDSAARRDEDRAAAHAYDIWLIASLARPSDHMQSREFLRRHGTSDVVEKACAIIASKFSTLDQSGWRHVLASKAFYSDRPIAERREHLDRARRVLLRWFDRGGSA